MQRFGVMIRRQLPIEPTLEQLHTAGVRLVQLWCLDNELDVRRPLDAAGERALAAPGRLGVAVSSLCCDTGKGFVNPAVLEEQSRVLASACDLCRRMDVAVLSTHVGAFTDEDVPRLRDTLRRAGDACAARGVTLATETGAESGDALRALLDAVDHPRVRVNFDPANLVRRGFDLRDAVTQLGPFIVHAHAKDGVRGGGEVVIGRGDVPWRDYLAWLDEAGYHGPMVVEREVDAHWLDDALTGWRYLSSVAPGHVAGAAS